LWGDTTPDGDNWHFFGFYDSGEAFMHTNPGEVNVLAADRVGTQFSVDFAGTIGTAGRGLRWTAKVGSSYYLTDLFGTDAIGSVTGDGLVSEWETEVLDVESATWYLWDDTGVGGDADPTNGYNYGGRILQGLDTTPVAGLAPGDITTVGLFMNNNDNGHRWAVDNFVISVADVPEPTTYALFALGALACGHAARRRKKRLQKRS